MPPHHHRHGRDCQNGRNELGSPDPGRPGKTSTLIATSMRRFGSTVDRSRKQQLARVGFGSAAALRRCADHLTVRGRLQVRFRTLRVPGAGERDPTPAPALACLDSGRSGCTVSPRPAPGKPDPGSHNISFGEANSGGRDNTANIPYSSVGGAIQRRQRSVLLDQRWKRNPGSVPVFCCTVLAWLASRGAETNRVSKTRRLGPGRGRGPVAAGRVSCLSNGPMELTHEALQPLSR